MERNPVSDVKLTLNKCEFKKLFEEKSEKLTFKSEINKTSNL
jgi:hypothetical protein